MKSIMKIFLTLLLLNSFAYSSEYDKMLLKAHAKLVPKIVLLDQSLEQKLVDGKVKILIVSESQDKVFPSDTKDLPAKFEEAVGAYKESIKTSYQIIRLNLNMLIQIH